MLSFSDWVKVTQSQDGDLAVSNDLEMPKPPEELDGKPGQEPKVKESRPYTRSLRYYPSITPPTGGGPNFQYIQQDGLASANAKQQGVGKDGNLAKARVVASPSSPGMGEKEIQKRLKDWKKLSGSK